MTKEEKTKFMQSMLKVAENETDHSKQRVSEETGRVLGINFMIHKMEDYFRNMETEPEVAPVQLNEKPKVEKPAKVKRKVVIDIGKAKALRAAGWSYEKIADEFGCATQTIINHMKAYMVKQEKENNGL